MEFLNESFCPFCKTRLERTSFDEISKFNNQVFYHCYKCGWDGKALFKATIEILTTTDELFCRDWDCHKPYSEDGGGFHSDGNGLWDWYCDSCLNGLDDKIKKSKLARLIEEKREIQKNIDYLEGKK